MVSGKRKEINDTDRGNMIGEGQSDVFFFVSR